MKPIRTKICGITRVTDAVATASAGADAIGLNFYSLGKRFIEPDAAKQVADSVRDRVAIVGVFVNSSIEEICRITTHVGLSHVQFHGDEQPTVAQELQRKLSKVASIRAIRVCDDNFAKAQLEIDQWESAGVGSILLDAASTGAFGGTGKQLNWSAINDLAITPPWLLAGGLNPDNVADAIKLSRPGGVDVASGVESSAGIKDMELVRTFIQNASDAQQ